MYLLISTFQFDNGYDFDYKLTTFKFDQNLGRSSQNRCRMKPGGRLPVYYENF